MNSNLAVQLRRIVAPESPLLVGTVFAHNPDQTSTVILSGGGVVRARGTSVAVGNRAWVRDGEVRGEAPELDAVTLVIY